MRNEELVLRTGNFLVGFHTEADLGGFPAKAILCAEFSVKTVSPTF